MQLTFVCERWPLRRLGSTVGGLLALVAAWAVALVLFFGLVSFHPPPGSGLRGQGGPLAPAELGALLVLTGLWQVLFYIAWNGWPFTRLINRTVRLLAGNVAVVGAGTITYVIARAVGLAAVNVIALAGSFIAAALLLGLLFDGWLPGPPKPSSSRAITILVDLVLATTLYAAVDTYADHLHWTIAHPTEWVAHVMLNAIAFSVILHVAIGQRWPFGRRAGDLAVQA